MPSTHQMYNGGWCPQFFETRAAQVGSHTEAYIQRLLSQYTYPEIAYKQCQGILALGKDYTPERLERACHRALDYHKAGYHTIERILKAGLDQVEELPVELPRIPVHTNIRGAAEYR